MLPQQRNRWIAYTMEAVGLGGFVMIAGLAAIFCEHPNMPVMESWLKNYPTLRRVPLGIVIGLYISIIVLLFGKRSGTHINPAVTWTFYRLGNINLKDAVLYTIAQFAGATAGAFILKFSLDKWFSHPDIHYGITKPMEPHGSLGAFTAELIISFITMWVLLMASSLKKLEKKLPFLMGLLLAVFIIVELPYSGMSMNPARSFAGAAAANKWNHLWIYFIAPIIAMLVAGELFLLWKRKKIIVEIQAQSTKENELQKINNFPVVESFNVPHKEGA